MYLDCRSYHFAAQLVKICHLLINNYLEGNQLCVLCVSAVNIKLIGQGRLFVEGFFGGDQDFDDFQAGLAAGQRFGAV